MEIDSKIKAEICFMSNSKGTAVDIEIFFECDRNACEVCNNEECHLTRDISHAKRFDLCE